MGEHAVVYGAPALVAAVDLRARAAATTGSDVPPGHVRLELPDLDHAELLRTGEVRDYAARARRRWEEFSRSPDRESFARMRGEGPGHVSLVALGEAMEAAVRRGEGAEEERGVRVTVSSDIPIGRGFGSSAAVASSTTIAWLARAGIDPSRDELEELLLDVERRQHGQPSGVDAAAVLRGGLVWADRASDGSGLRFESISVPSDLLDRFRVVDTGAPAENTGEVVSAVRELRDRDPETVADALSRIREATVSFRSLLEEAAPDPSDAVRLVRRCQRGLEELGVVPEPVRELVRAVEREGGAAKISGAGALTSPPDGPPGGGLLLLIHPDPDRIRGWSFLADLNVIDVRPGAPGARIEEGR